MLAPTSPGKRDSIDATTDVASRLKTTQLQSSPSESPPTTIGFTSLPPSVRNKIYAHILDTELVNAGQPNVSYTHTIKDSTLRFSASRPPFPVQTALFYVSKQISEEARHFFYSQNLFVRFEIYSADARHAKTMLEDSGLLFSIAAPEDVERCKAHVMDLTVVEKGSAMKRASVVFPAQYLPRLINFMERASKASASWASTHSLFIVVRNMYDLEIPRVQGDLLELFRLLNNIGKVELEGEELLDGYADGLQRSMMAATFEADEWMKTVTEMVDRADKASDTKSYFTAAQHAQASIIFMTYGYLTRAEALHSQPESFHKSIQRLRWRTELLLANALYSELTIATSKPSGTAAQKQIATTLLAAETAASHALSLATDSASPVSNPWIRSLPAELIPPNKAEWFTGGEQGRSWYVLGLVHIALSEHLFAAGDLERAVGLLGDSKDEKLRSDVEKAFARARDGIDWEVRPGVGLRKAARVARREID